MEYKELVEHLKEWNENLISEMCADDVLTCDDLCGCTGDCIVVQAATAITDLLARAAAEEARAEKAERERDAAVKDMEALMWFSGEGCHICAHEIVIHKEPYVRSECALGNGAACCPTWRGRKEE